MIAIESLLAVCQAFCIAEGIEEKTLSSRLFDDGKKIRQLRDGAEIGVRRYNTAMIWLADNFPEGGNWPVGVDRPVVGLTAGSKVDA